MGVIDMFIHPIADAAEADLFDLSALDWSTWTYEMLTKMDQSGIVASGVCVMDDRILDRPAHLKRLADATATQRLWFTFMPDMRRADTLLRIEQAAAAGFKGITFHSYLQEIAPSKYPLVTELAKRAEALGLFTGLCTAYGSKRIFDYYSLPLAAELAKQVSAPILLYHNGGARVLEALLLCEMWPNLYMETSFSLSYWMGSSVEKDLAFSLKKLGAKRVMFGSDAPFIPSKVALRDHLVFFNKYGLTTEEQALVLGNAARAVFPFLSQI
jgi:predicted TIM-barrel fold metal-dependent hydrolase